jgi:hypothetical protein
MPHGSARSCRLKFKSVLPVIAMLAICGITISCAETANNPSPSISTLSPATATAGATGFTLAVNGSGFAPQSVIEFNGIGRIGNTLFASQSQLTTQINPSDIAEPGIILVQVNTPAPGGGTTGTLNFTINPGQSQTPQVTSISPASALAGGGELPLIVYGANFTSSSVVTLSGGNLQTIFVNNGQLNTTVPSSDLTNATPVAAPYQVGVLNPSPGGGASNTMPLVITNPPPSITSLVPNPVAVLATPTTTNLEVLGNGFDLASQIYFNGVPQTTFFVSQGELTTTLSTSATTTAGTFPVTVVNPAPGGGTSNPSGFSATAGTSGLGLPSQIDVSTTGVQANTGTTDTTTSGPVISANGQFIAFASPATNLFLPDTYGVANIFEQNNCLAITSLCTPGTILASVSGTATQANGPSSYPSMDASGRYVAFTSTATNLIQNPSVHFDGTQQVYFRDTCTGITTTCTPFTILVSTPDGTNPANADSFQPSLSPDGRYVSYTSAATNLPGNSSVQQIFLFDTCNGITGCAVSTTLVSAGTNNQPGNGASMQSVLGNDGLYVAFNSMATNLVSSTPAGTPQQIFQRSTCIDQTGCTPATQLASTPDGTTPGNGSSFQPTMTQDGRIVAFASTATNLTSNVTNGIQQVFQRDICTEVSGCTPATSLVSLATDGSSAGNAASGQPSLSPATDQYIAFASFASNLVANDTNNLEDVFVRNTCAGASSCSGSTVLVSLSAPQVTGGLGVQGNQNSLSPALSGDGNSVAFISAATNLLPYPTIDQNNVFLAYTTF